MDLYNLKGDQQVPFTADEVINSYKKTEKELNDLIVKFNNTAKKILDARLNISLFANNPDKIEEINVLTQSLSALSGQMIDLEDDYTSLKNALPDSY